MNTCMTSCVAARQATFRPQAQGQTGRLFLARSSPASRAARLITFASVDRAAVLEDVRTIIAEQLGKEVGDVTPDAKFTDLGADSLDTVEIMMALEEKFDLQLDEDGAEQIATVQDAAELISGQIEQA